MPDQTPQLRIHDEGRVRIMTLNRPQALNAFSEELYTRSSEAIEEAAADPGVAVLVLTGTGRAFSSGADVVEMAARARDRRSEGPASAFPRFVSDLTNFPKPLVCAVNGLALGIGVTLLGYADLVFMSTEARIRCPFTDLAVAPEAGSSYLLPMLVGRQNAAWLLMSSEWLTAEECREIGLAWKICPPENLMEETLAAAQLLAAKPIASLVETKRTLMAGHRDAIVAARSREDLAFQRLMGQPANLEAFAALSARRTPEFVRVDCEHPVDVVAHASES